MREQLYAGITYRQMVDALKAYYDEQTILAKAVELIIDDATRRIQLQEAIEGIKHKPLNSCDLLDEEIQAWNTKRGLI